METTLNVRERTLIGSILLAIFVFIAADLITDSIQGAQSKKHLEGLSSKEIAQLRNTSEKT